MTDKTSEPFETIKKILRQARNPELLDEHPWVHSLIVQEALEKDPHLARARPGQQLVSAIAGLFPQLQPATPPRHGLRLDPRWGEFGLLGALYFMPYNNGSSYPTSHLEAWGRIDPAILYFVFGKPADQVSEEQIQTYALVGDDLDGGFASTLSDWHRKGIRRLAEIVLNRERYLARASAKPSIILHPNFEEDSGHAESKRPRQSPLLNRVLRLSFALCLFLLVGVGTFKTWKVYTQGRLVYQNVTRLREVMRASLAIDTLDRAGPVLSSLQADLAAFKQEAGPFLWLAPRLGWVPVYGGDLTYAPELTALADHLVDAAVLGYSAASPLFEILDSSDAGLDSAGLTALLVQAQPELSRARGALDRALAARAAIDAGRLSPRLQSLLVDELDPLLALADEGLSFAQALPTALGASGEGPKTYLLLVQNEDELRPTGGFITTIGTLVLHRGKIISLKFEGVDNVQEDWSKPYPAAPWQLQEYMNSPVLILRDANWFSDFPTTVSWVEYLYAYTHSHSVDGVIALDQRFLVILLNRLGPLEVEGVPYPLTAENVVAYMRAAKEPPAGEPVPADWYRKGFIEDIAGALLEKISAGRDLDWLALSQGIFQALEERHLLLQIDNPRLAALLATRGWDNAVRAGEGDFLMLTDTNIGFNKTNAVVEVSLAYDVDLQDLDAPRASLLVTHTNMANPQVPCIHWYAGTITGDWMYPIDRCYWDYLRVYKQAGTELLLASTHGIPAEQLVSAAYVPPHVDALEEDLPGVTGFGTLLVVPGGRSWNTGFTFALPASVLTEVSEPGQLAYRLKVHKQPGTLAELLTVRVHLPANAGLVSASRQAVVQGNNLLVKTNLRTDVDLEIVFRRP